LELLFSIFHLHNSTCTIYIHTYSACSAYSAYSVMNQVDVLLQLFYLQLLRVYRPEVLLKVLISLANGMRQDL